MEPSLAVLVMLVSTLINTTSPYCLSKIHNATWTLDYPVEGVATGYKPIIVAETPKTIIVQVVSLYSNQTLQPVTRMLTREIVQISTPTPVPLASNTTLHLVYETNGVECIVTVSYYWQDKNFENTSIGLPKPKGFDPLQVLNETLKFFNNETIVLQEKTLDNTTASTNAKPSTETEHVSSVSDHVIYFIVLAAALLVLIVDHLSSPRHAS